MAAPIFARCSSLKVRFFFSADVRGFGALGGVGSFTTLVSVFFAVDFFVAIFIAFEFGVGMAGYSATPDLSVAVWVTGREFIEDECDLEQPEENDEPEKLDCVFRQIAASCECEYLFHAIAKLQMPAAIATTQIMSMPVCTAFDRKRFSAAGSSDMERMRASVSSTLMTVSSTARDFARNSSITAPPRVEANQGAQAPAFGPSRKQGVFGRSWFGPLSV